MKLFYDFVFLLFSLIYLPYLLLKGKTHKDFIQRFGILPAYLRGERKDVIWVHAVSVGEVKAAESFIRRLKDAFPEKRIFLSTTTRTGNEIAGKIFGDAVPKFYFPLDFHFVVERTIDFLNPLAFILFETEIWPNLIIGLSERRIPIVLVNGRISDKSFRGYRLIKPVFASILRMIDLFLMQTQADREKMTRMGALPERVKVCGNVKYDVGSGLWALGSGPDLDKENLGIREDEDLIICGSTHKGEDEILLEVYKELLKEFSSLHMLLAPRHVDRADDIDKLCEKFGFKSMRLSKISPKPKAKSPQPILILDTIGQLAEIYSMATVVFMGGSLVKKGGHNLVEPARFAKPIIFGPHMDNFRDMADQFLKKGASIMVRNKSELKEITKGLLKDKSKINEIGLRALSIIRENKGAVDRIIKEIRDVLKYV